VNNPNCPTYGSFTYLTWERAEDRTGQKATATLSKEGVVGDDTSKGGYAGTEIAYFEEATGHNVPQALWDFMNQNGLIYLNGSYQTGKVVDWLFAMGYPISEPYWTRCTVGGVEKDVLVQLFERRVLTYTPSNKAGWQVEMGNVGQHYHSWRYGSSSGAPFQPGVYTFEGLCTQITLAPSGQAYLIWCVESVSVEHDSTMKFNVSWTAFSGNRWVWKLSDIGNRNMYVTDDLGNRYDHVDMGGAAPIDVKFFNGQTIRGWFLFPPAQSGATSFTFHDDDNRVQIGGIVLRH
jgi:hypothetical protein